MHIRLDDLPEIREEGYPLVMKKAITRDRHGPDISITWVKIWGHHQRMVCDISDRPYYIIEGEAIFQLGDDEPFQVRAGDFVFIPRGVPYEFSGHMTYLVMNGPAFLSGSDQVIGERRLPGDANP
jgi:mannose-6-phosphate isomerase-like protein (cupin superfamily)